MTIHPLQGGDGFLMEINGDFIQALYRERDEALARNRDLEKWMEAAREMINCQAKENARLTLLLAEVKG